MEISQGTILNGAYNIIRLLGRGGMGNAYLADTMFHPYMRVVIKELNPFAACFDDPEQAGQLFKKEAEFMKRFSHDGIPKIFDFFKENDRDYLVIEYIDGQTLEEILKSNPASVTVEKSISWAIEIADIMDYLHNSFEFPIVYRDIKPANIMITQMGRIKLIDFGIARYYNPDKSIDTFRLGSPGYAPPELYKGIVQSSPQSDIYSLGVLLFQMLTKYDPTESPFKFPPMKSLYPDIPDKLEKIVLKSIEIQPLNRYLSMKDFKEALMDYMGIKEEISVIKPQSRYKLKTLRTFGELVEDWAPIMVTITICYPLIPGAIINGRGYFIWFLLLLFSLPLPVSGIMKDISPVRNILHACLLLILLFDFMFFIYKLLTFLF
ncbi:MAG: serine/threonine-protein kinase [Candidatus Eremiobacterota bacterium]